MFGLDDHDKDKDDQSKSGRKPDDSSSQDWQHPGAPLNDNDSSGSSDKSPADNSEDKVIKPTEDTEDKIAGETNDDAEQPKPASDPAPDNTAPLSSSANDDLIDIKQEALTKLSPLVGHLDQPPEEKFRTLMMMIQASDDQTKIKAAYEAALQIEDEKSRAQALLDVVNEINYFTQNPAKPE